MMRVWRLSLGYIGPKSRTERPWKTKVGTAVANVTHDSDTTFKVKRSKVNLQGAGHIVAASRTACYCDDLLARLHIEECTVCEYLKTRIEHGVRPVPDLLTGVEQWAGHYYWHLSFAYYNRPTHRHWCVRIQWTGEQALHVSVRLLLLLW